MQFLILALDCYFAAVLGIAGLAKMDDPAPFAALLRRQRLLPAWSVGTISRLVPWLEIAIAGALLSGIATIVVAAFTLLVYASFLVIQILLLATKHGGDCGCYGAASPHRVERASVGTAALLACLASVHLWLVDRATAVGWPCRLVAGICFAGIMGWLGWHIRQRRVASCRSQQIVAPRSR